MGLKPWRVLETSYLREDVRVDRCETARGSIIEPLILEYRPWVTVLALTETQEVVLIQEYRHGIQGVIWELPAGGAEEGETSLEAARRELLEETGFAAEGFIEIGKSSPNPDSHTNTHHSILALDVKRVGEQKLDETEEIDVTLLPLEEVIGMARRGELPNAMHLTTLFYTLAYLKRLGPEQAGEREIKHAAGQAKEAQHPL